MTYVYSLIFLFMTTVAAQAATPGFSRGDQFYSIPLQGIVTVYCGTDETATYNCYDTVLDPSSYDFFVGPEGVQAQEVSLSCLRSDGSIRQRNEPYNSNGAKTIHPLNLWINTPFQRPLLALGENKINYSLFDSGKIVDQGSFSVNVAHGAPRTCPSTHYNSTDLTDCKSPYSVCQRYFEQYDYCQN